MARVFWEAGSQEGHAVEGRAGPVLHLAENGEPPGV